MINCKFPKSIEISPKKTCQIDGEKNKKELNGVTVNLKLGGREYKVKSSEVSEKEKQRVIYRRTLILRNYTEN